jgi:hypothetical protein
MNQHRTSEVRSQSAPQRGRSADEQSELVGGQPLYERIAALTDDPKVE